MISSNLFAVILKTLLCFTVVSCDRCFTAELVEKEAKTKSQASSEMDYIKAIAEHTYLDGRDQDPSIQIVRSDSQKPHFLTLAFLDIPGNPPYRLESQRILQDDPNLFYEATDAQETLNAMAELGVPFGMLMPQNAYLPGERVTWRISSEDGKVLKEATCCPNPKVMRTASGKRIMEAALLSINRPDTVYILLFPPMKEAREFIFTSEGKKSSGIVPSNKLITTPFGPRIEGFTGGIAKIEIRLENEMYELELPWGTKFEIDQSIEGFETNYILDDGAIKSMK